MVVITVDAPFSAAPGPIEVVVTDRVQAKECTKLLAAINRAGIKMTIKEEYCSSRYNPQSGWAAFRTIVNRL